MLLQNNISPLASQGNTKNIKFGINIRFDIKNIYTSGSDVYT